MEPSQSSRSLALDAVVAFGLCAVGVYEVLVTPLAEDVVGGPVWLDLLAVGLGTLPLLWRRRFPFWVALAVYAVIAGRALVADPLELYPMSLAALVATYSVASYAPLRDALLSAAFSALALAVAVVEGSGTDATPDPLASAILFGTVWLVGRVVGVRNERARALHESRDQHAAEAVAAERARIARELHDVVSHSLAAIVMQSGGARHVLDSDPERARDSLAAIEQTARRGLEEMRRMLGLLGDAGTADEGLAPQPGLARLEELVRRGPVRRARGDDHGHRRAGAAAGGGRRRGVPGRPGGAHQRDEARRGPDRGGAGRLLPGRARDRGPGRRLRRGTRAHRAPAGGSSACASGCSCSGARSTPTPASPARASG